MKGINRIISMLLIAAFCGGLTGCTSKEVASTASTSESRFAETSESSADTLSDSSQALESHSAVLDASAMITSHLSGANGISSPSQSSSSESEKSSTTIKDIPMGKNNVLLFEAKEKRMYNYCPSIMQMNENTRYVYYCTNKESDRIVDHIGCRKGTRNADNTWSYGDEVLVLAPTPGAWDLEHDCDPSVIKGEFAYNGKSYTYLMAFLGAATKNNQENATGLAVANDPMGPWTKCDAINPLIPFVRDMTEDDQFQWGNGQPSLVSVDKKGEILLFYSVGTPKETRMQAERWDLSNLNEPKRRFSAAVPRRGLTDLNGAANDFLNNGDFCYDPIKKRFYAASDTHPTPTPNFISGAFRVTYIGDNAGENDKIGRVFQNPAGKCWTLIANIGEAQTGKQRNHNVGVVTDPYGWMLSRSYLEVIYTMGIETHDSWYAYRLYSYFVPITE